MISSRIRLLDRCLVALLCGAWGLSPNAVLEMFWLSVLELNVVFGHKYKWPVKLRVARKCFRSCRAFLLAGKWQRSFASGDS